MYEGCRIYGKESTINYTDAQVDYFDQNITQYGDPPNLSFGLYVNAHVRSAGYIAFSDERIKSNIVDINDTTALEQVRQLKPKYYEYKDTVNRGSISVFGFIAQEVKDVIPRAVSVADGEIPNIYEMATIISTSNTVTFTNFNTSDLEGTLIAYLAEEFRYSSRTSLFEMDFSPTRSFMLV